MRNSHTHSFGCDKTRRTIIGRFSNSRVWLFAWMAIATTLLGRTLLSPGPAPLELASASMPVELRSAGHRADGRTATVHSFRPIESLRVGDRVVADNPDTATPEQTAVDPATWRLVKLYAEETWPDGTLDTIHIETLQPPEWLELFGVEQGAEVPPPIDLVEMGLPEDLDTTVVGIEPCPRIQPGPGRVVLTTVNHLNNDVWKLTAVDSVGKHEMLSPTGLHKFYSENRRNWVSTKEIHDNEIIRGRTGPLTIVAKESLPGVKRVYNLTVEGEHVYYVSELGLLAHNTCPVGQLAVSKNTARQNLRRSLNGNVGDDLRAHHLIPLEAITDPRSAEIIAAAARGGFNINAANNGVLLNKLFHRGGHPKLIERTIRSLSALNGRGLNDAQVAHQVQNIANRQRDLLQKVEPSRLKALEDGTRTRILIQ